PERWDTRKLSRTGLRGRFFQPAEGDRSCLTAVVEIFGHSRGRWSRRPSPCRNLVKRNDRRSESWRFPTSNKPKRCPEQPYVKERATHLRSRHNRLRRVVLLGASPGTQPHCGSAVQVLSRTETVPHPQQSTSGWLRSDGLLLRQPTPVCSVRNWLREFGESRAFAGSESA